MSDGVTTVPPRPPVVLSALAMVSVAVNLRTVMASVPPLVDAISSDLALSNLQIGVLTTLPVLCMGVFAPTATIVARRVGADRAVLVAVATLLVGILLRPVGSLWALYAGSLVAGIGIATVGTLLPGLVKQLFPGGRAGLATGLYMFAMSAGAAGSAALSVPLAGILGGWQRALAWWALPAALGLAVWTLLLRSARTRTPTAGGGTASGRVGTEPGHRLPWREATAWLLAAYMAAGSTQFYSSLAWLAPTFVGLGWTPERAGYLLSLFSAVQIGAGLAVPALADRVRDRRILLLPAAACGLSGELGVWHLPEVAPWLWGALLGIGQGAAFSLGLVLLAELAGSAAASSRLAGLVLGFGYSIAAFGPMAMGAVLDATGRFEAVWVVLVALMVPQVAAALSLGPHRRLVH